MYVCPIISKRERERDGERERDAESSIPFHTRILTGFSFISYLKCTKKGTNSAFSIENRRKEGKTDLTGLLAASPHRSSSERGEFGSPVIYIYLQQMCIYI